MPTTINIKRILDEELRVFKSRPDIYLPDLQCSKLAVDYVRDIVTDFAHNIIREALKDVRIEKRLMPVFINDILNKRLDLPFVDSIMPKPRDMTFYSYKSRKTAKNNSEIKLIKNG